MRRPRRAQQARRVARAARGLVCVARGPSTRWSNTAGDRHGSRTIWSVIVQRSRWVFQQIVKRLENALGTNIKDSIILKRSYAHKEFISEFNSYKGNAYGLANTLFQTAIFKPRIKNKKLTNMYYCGQLTVPGPGMPPSLVSGKIVAKQIIKEHA